MSQWCTSVLLLAGKQGIILDADLALFQWELSVRFRWTFELWTMLAGCLFLRIVIPWRDLFFLEEATVSIGSTQGWSPPKRYGVLCETHATYTQWSAWSCYRQGYCYSENRLFLYRDTEPDRSWGANCYTLAGFIFPGGSDHINWEVIMWAYEWRVYP